MRALSANEAPRVSVAEFGAVPDAADVGPAVQRALATLKGANRATLVFPPGSYNFAATTGVCMALVGLPGLTIEGTGAHLLFNGVVAPLVVRNCPRLTLRGFTVDWGRLPYVQGEVVEVTADRRCAVLRADAVCAVSGNESFGRIGLYDRGTGALVPNGLDTANVIERVEVTGSQLLRLTFNGPLPLRPGNTLVLRDAKHGRHVMSVSDCHDLSVQDIKIFASPAMGLAAGNCHGVSIRNVTVGPKPGTGRLLSTNADAIHLATCHGDIAIMDSSFTAMGDDAINVTGRFLPVTFRGGDPKQATVQIDNDPTAASAMADGDKVQVVSQSDLSTVELATIQHMDGNTLYLDRSAPPARESGYSLIDLTRTPRLHIKNCRFVSNRARGVLAHTDVLIEKCEFRRQSGPAILMAPDLMWNEGPQTERAMIRDNVIEAANSMDPHSGAVRIDAFVSPNGHKEVSISNPVNRDVVVERNTFIRCHSAAIYASSVRNLYLSRNVFKQTSDPAIVVKNASNWQIVDNRSENPSTISCKPADQVRATLRNNENLSLVSP